MRYIKSSVFLLLCSFMVLMTVVVPVSRSVEAAGSNFITSETGFTVDDILPEADFGVTTVFDSMNNRFLVVYSKQIEGDKDIYGQIVNMDGTLFGSRIPVSLYEGNQTGVCAAYNPATRQYLVAWTDYRIVPGAPWTDYGKIYGQLINDDGSLDGENFMISPPDMWLFPGKIVYCPEGNRFFMLCISGGLSSPHNLAGCFLEPDGTVTPLFPVTDYTSGYGIWRYEAVYDPNNHRILVIWGHSQETEEQIHGQLINHDGSFYGQTFVVSPIEYPIVSVAFSPDDNLYFVLFNETVMSGYHRDRAIVLDSEGNTAVPEFTILFDAPDHSFVSDVFYEKNIRKFLVTGSTINQPSCGRYISSDGSPYGTAFPLTVDDGYGIVSRLYDGNNKLVYLFINPEASPCVLKGKIVQLNDAPFNEASVSYTTNWSHTSLNPDEFISQEITATKSWNTRITNVPDDSGLPVNQATLTLNAATAFNSVFPAPSTSAPPDYLWDIGTIEESVSSGVYGCGMADQPVTVGYTPGFNISRTFNQTIFTSGNPSTQVMTLTTMPVSQEVTGLEINVSSPAETEADATILSADSISPENCVLSPDGKSVTITLSELSPGLATTLTVTLQVETDVDELEYKPSVSVRYPLELISSGMYQDSSTSYTDSECGTWTWAASEPCWWKWEESVNKEIILPSVCTRTTGGISGYVYEADGETPVGNASVYVCDASGIPCSTVYTETDGCYTTTGLHAGSYYVNAEAPGFLTEWYDNASGLDTATPVNVVIPGTTSGIDFTLDVPPPPAPVIISPAVGATGISLTPTFTWEPVAGAHHYEIMLSVNPDFTIIEWAYNVNDPLCTATGALRCNTTYYWKVRGVLDAGSTTFTPWSTGIFTTIEGILITGETRGVNGTVLPGVTVSTNETNSTVSKQDGTFELKITAPGTYTITAEKPGYRSQSLIIVIDELTGSYTLDFKGNFGLVPNIPNLSYVLACINKWKFPPAGLGLDISKVLSVINAWKYPIFPNPD